MSFSLPEKTFLRVQKLLIWLFVLCFLWGLQLSTSSAFTEKERAAIEQAKKLHAKGHYPSDLPQAKPEKPSVGSGCSRSSSVRTPSPAVAGCLRFAPFVLIGVVVLLILFLLWSTLRSTQLGKEETIPEAEHAPEILGRRLEKEHSLEDFLSVGDWEGAICYLLLDAMRLVGWRPDGQGLSETPRDVFSRLPKDKEFSASLFRLLRLAEEVRFGGKEATRSFFEQGEQAFRHFKSLYLKWTEAQQNQSAS